MSFKMLVNLNLFLTTLALFYSAWAREPERFAFHGIVFIATAWQFFKIINKEVA